MDAWRGFKKGNWSENIDTRDFIQLNYTPYEGDESFLAEPTERTKNLWKKAEDLILEEVRSKTIKVDTTRVSGINNYPAGYLDKENELIVGFQTDEPMKRIVNPYGGYRMVTNSLDAYGLKMDPTIEKYFNEFRKTHNQGVFDAYTSQMRKARTVGLLTGLPDAYGRGRIIGDYRRVALYGIDRLREDKLNEFRKLESELASEDIIRLREELSEQYRALDEMKKMALEYGYDISVPATNAKEAIQWLYFAYLAAVKENNGAAMSLGRNGGFLDIYIKRDIDEGTLTESEAQELIDQFVMKLRMMRHLRTPEYDDLFAGDPTWVTESLGGMGLDGRTLVTKTAFRILHTLTNLDSSPEPNMTVLWSLDLPEAWKNYCSKMSIQTGSLQYENDDAMRPVHGDDYAIACCVSSMVIGKQMQFFGARANLAKSLLYAINGGVDEMKRAKDGSLIKVLDGIEPIKDEVLDFDKVYANYKLVLEKVAKLYVNTMNTIHYMHDKYAYEAGQMALHDTFVHRYMAFGVAGISIVADSLSAIKYAKVKPIRDENGLAIDFEVEGDFPTYGNDDDRVDSIAVEVIEGFMEELRKTPTYRNSEHTLSILTITSNVVYGKKTGTTPDGRKKGEPFAPGANPMHGRDKTGAIASLNSVAKIPFAGCCQDGISNTFSIVPTALGKSEDERKVNLTNLMDGYFEQLAFHLNVNVLDRATLLDAYDHPEKYPNLTIRVSGYAVRFNRLTKEQQMEVIHRTFHESR
ncbi:MULTISPECIES: formate C-acetyltransferase [Parvimonas]|uniref:formate C-acetyltransferase n=1 Tax=Parvimonas TaxID=543311 RepID=UPI0020045089|nr:MULTISPECIES: formate C-acetyltransferase [Parvimonas]MCK6131050.1 formate C-acetyltransferase [Parvimonas micra]MCK6136698.1 formate C-acetyltransferase [Parvimonas micra]MCK6138169.1 formate C-acetyltransferase [Parvimonas micra]MCK6154709.1 formate C-acetyltransferase [Parvimonas micra]MEB3058779.1 formate C-acetyltransferase [Parvimonas sp. D9]